MIETEVGGQKKLKPFFPHFWLKIHISRTGSSKIMVLVSIDSELDKLQFEFKTISKSKMVADL